MGIYLWPLQEMETGCSFTSPRLHLYPMLLFFPIYFFLSLCSSPRLKFWHGSLSLNREDNKNLKPIPVWKGCLCQIPLPSVDVLEERCMAVWKLIVHYCSSPTALQGMASGSWEHSTTLQMNQRQCLLYHFASSAISLWQGQVLWTWHRTHGQPGVCSSRHIPNCLCSVSYCIPALWPSAHLKV